MYVQLIFFDFDNVHLTCEHDQNAHEKALLVTQMLRKLDYNRAQAGCVCPLLQLPIFLGILLLIYTVPCVKQAQEHKGPYPQSIQHGKA